MQKKTKQKGFSLIEVILALAIFALFWSSISALSIGGFSATEEAGNHTEAGALAQEGVEAVRTIADRAWNEMIFGTSSVEISGNIWEFGGTNTTENIGKFTRIINFNDICRNVDNDLDECPSDRIDLYSKEVVSKILWEIRPGVNNQVEYKTIISNWDSVDWVQSDWVGGNGQFIWSDMTQYFSDDGNIFIDIAGQISLPDGRTSDSGFDLAAGPQSFDWNFDTPADYSYNSSEIEVTSGVARLVSSVDSTFRIKEYYISDGQFTGTTYNLTLDQDLAEDYFVIIQGSDGDTTGNGDRGPDENYASLTSDPNGTGDLNTSGATNRIGLTRNNAVNSWVGVVTVVESINDSDNSGFNLLGVERVTHTGANTSGTDTSVVSWTDINQVMLMGGFNGSGCNTPATATASHKVCHTKIYPSGTDTINWNRNAAGATLSESYSTVMVIDWGDDWNVQRVNVTGNNGGDGANAIGEYNTAVINSVVRDNTWVWGTGWTDDQGIGDASEGTLITLGDGVNENANETTVAVGQEYSDTRDFEVYTLTHDDLSVDYLFKSDGNSADLTVDLTVDSATDNTGRMAIVTNGQNGTGDAYPRPIFSARYIADDTVRLERRRSGQPFPAWVQGIDFSAIIPSVGMSGSGVNPDFTADASSWTYNDWEQGARVDGNYQSSGGNPGGYIDIDLENRKNDTISGYWEQSFTTTEDNPSIGSLNLDWIVSAYDNRFINSFEIYAFVDSASGAPTVGTEVWSQSVSGTSGWASSPTIDISSELGLAGDYYVKIAVRVITGGGGGANNGQHLVGFDNVSIYWEAATAGASYPDTNPTITPTSSFSVSGSGVWSEFTETATKNGGEIYYQLSDDDGVTWRYWSGSSWGVAGPSNYNTATEVDANISSFSTLNEQIKWRAFLSSDGTQQVILDNIRITYSPTGASWEFNNWIVSGGENSPIGSVQTSGGNPLNYVDVTIPAGNNDEVGGIWSQEFEVNINNPSPVTFDFDYKVFDYNGIPDSATIRVYVDMVEGGIPTTAVGSPINVTGEGSWISASQIDLSSVVTSPGIYYLKITFYVETGVGGGSGPFTVGFDNAALNLGNGAYPTSGELISSAYDMSDESPVQIIEWIETVPTANENIRFQIRTALDSGGSPGTWTDWYGSGGSGTYFDNPDGELISTDLNGNQWVQYRVELTGDGTDTPVLEEIIVNYQ